MVSARTSVTGGLRPQDIVLLPSPQPEAGGGTHRVSLRRHVGGDGSSTLAIVSEIANAVGVVNCPNADRVYTTMCE